LVSAHGRELGVTLEILVGLVEQVSVDQVFAVHPD